MEMGLRGGMQDKFAQSVTDLFLGPVGMLLPQDGFSQLPHAFDESHPQLQALTGSHSFQRGDLRWMKTIIHDSGRV